MRKLKKIIYPQLSFVAKSYAGFTLLETVVAIFVITIGLTGGVSIILQALNLSFFSSSKLTAAYLAQEGIEIVRNIRDTNWLEARNAANDWDEGLNNCSAGCLVDYNHSYGPSQIDPILPPFADQFLNMDADGFYSYNVSSQTKFKRKIIIQKPNPDTLEVVVQVSWSEKGKSFTFSTQENLYSWR